MRATAGDITYISGKIPGRRSLLNLYEDAGWKAYTAQPDTLIAGIENSLKVYTAYDDKKLVGLARIVGDGKTFTYLLDILVMKSYQRMGIGRKLMAILTDDYGHTRQFVLLTDDSPATDGFYKACGLTPAEESGCRDYL